jgi:hypothetical protein
MKVEFSKPQDLKASDVYSAVFSLYEMITRRQPWA